MRRFCFLLLLVVADVPSQAQLVGIAEVISPGLMLHGYALHEPNSVKVLEINLTTKRYVVESFRPARLEKTSKQVEMNSSNGQSVLGAINADFFSFKTSWPIGNQVVNGKFVQGIASVRSHVAFDEEGKPYFERLSFAGWFATRGNKRYPIAGVNSSHSINSIVFHTSYSDSTTSFSVPGKTFALQLISPRWIAGDTLRMVVTHENVDERHVIGSREAVLWMGSGPEAKDAQESVALGDTLLVSLGFEPHLRRITEVVGGGGRILEGGRPVSDSTNGRERIGVVFLRSRHPRTFVGINRDTTRLYLCTVDGRQPASVGMSFQEMADFLLSIGASEAVNLDGGGSTTMVARGRVVNKPSDKTGERAVANSLQVVERKGEIQR
jgi:hypothetical protein